MCRLNRWEGLPARCRGRRAGAVRRVRRRRSPARPAGRCWRSCFRRGCRCRSRRCSTGCGGGRRGERAGGAGAARAVAATLRGRSRLFRLAADRRRRHRRRGGGAGRAAARRPAVPRLRAGGRGDRGDQLRRGGRALRLRGDRRLRRGRRRDRAGRAPGLPALPPGEGPIFARPLWSESNANPAIAARLAPLGRGFHGAPVAQTVDGLAAFDAATDRRRGRRRRPAVDRGLRRAACRAGLLEAAVRVALGGAPRRRVRSRPGSSGGRRGPGRTGSGRCRRTCRTAIRCCRTTRPTSRAEGALDRRRRAIRGCSGGRRTASAAPPGSRGAVHARATATGSPASPPAARGRDRRARARPGRGVPCAGPGAEVAGGGRCRGRAAAAAGGARRACRRSAGSRGTGCRTAGVARLTLAGSQATLGLERRPRAARAAALAARRARPGAPALGEGPFRRREVLTLIADCLGRRMDETGGRLRRWLAGFGALVLVVLVSAAATWPGG